MEKLNDITTRVHMHVELYVQVTIYAGVVRTFSSTAVYMYDILTLVVVVAVGGLIFSLGG